MTDNYQFDKNSKLFQKFLAMKANRGNQSTVVGQSQKGQEEQARFKNKSFAVKPKDHGSRQDRSTSNESFSRQQNRMLHVTIDDIEEAASVGLNESTANHSDIPEKQQNKVAIESDRSRNDVSAMMEAAHNEFEDIVEKHQVKVMPKQQRNRERRTRDFHERPRKREEPKQEEILMRATDTTTSQSKPSGFQISFKPRETRFNTHIQNLEPNVVQQEIRQKPEQINFTLGSRENEYRKKYEKMVIKCQELKEILQEQRKQKQVQAIQRQSENQILKEKYFQLRSVEDTLATDVKRFKDKLQAENIMRTKFEEEVKQLNFRIVELEQILEGKDAALKKKSDEIAYWKHQNQQLRTQLKQYTSQIQTLQQRGKFLDSEYKIMHKDVSHKQNLVDELRRNTGTLIEENNIAKDEIYKLTIRLYQLEQENMSLKADVMRKEKQFPHNLSMIQENYTKSIENMSPRRSLERMDRPRRQERDEVPTRQGGGDNRRRRQFARQRVTTKADRADRVQEREQKKQRRTQPERPQPTNQNRQIAARIQYIQNQLEERSKQKAMNGRLRKQKIQLQRQLQSLIQQVS